MNIALYSAENWTPREVDQKYLESSEMWYWRRMEISWTDRVRNEEAGGKEYPTNNREEEGQLDWSDLALELSSTTRYRRKERCDGKTRKKT